MDENNLQGEIRCENDLPSRISVEERNHRFIRIGRAVYRKNELWRIETDSVTSEVMAEELLMKNHAEVRYDVTEIPGICIIESD